MTIELSWGVATSAVIVGSAFVGIVKWIVGNSLEKRDTKIRTLQEAVTSERELRASSENALRSTVKVLFEKVDHLVQQFQDYKLHVAETYVNTSALEKMLQAHVDPIHRRLESIEKDLRSERRHG